VSTLPIVAGNLQPSAPEGLGVAPVNIPGSDLPTTTSVIDAINAANPAIGPGHFSQLTVDGPSALNGPVYFAATQMTGWFDCSPATVDPTVVLDFASGVQQYLFLTRDTIVWLPTMNQQEGMFYVLVEQDPNGPWLLTWKANNPTTDGSAVVYWPGGTEPTMTATAGALDLYTFTWCQQLNGGNGAFIGMVTQALKIPA
jgi:hypothetical protein